jgi:hypothetical protein
VPFGTTKSESWPKVEVERYWRIRGAERFAALARISSEWWAITHFSAIAFCDGVSGRRAVLRSGPDVWEIAIVARNYVGDRGT